MGPLPLYITVIYPQRNLDKIENDKNEVEFCFSFISFTLGKIRKNDKTEVDFRFSVKWDGVTAVRCICLVTKLHL